MLMDNLPRLRREPLPTKIALYKKVGGHPKSIELLNGWLAGGRAADLLADPALDQMLAQEWEGYFLRALLAHLTPAEQEALTRLSIFRTRLAAEEFDYAGVQAATVARWLDLSLLQQEEVPRTSEAPGTQADGTFSAYVIHPVVREYLLGRLNAADLRELHTWAATLQGRPFVEIARQAAAQSGQRWTETQIEATARSVRGVVGQLVARTDDLDQARAAMARALEWQHHLLAAGEYEAAGEIVFAVVPILDRWGERDRAKALLRGSIDTREGGNRAVAQGNLASLLQEEGKLAEALDTYRAVYRTFESLGAKPQMAGVLSQQSNALLRMGRYDQAIARQEESLQIRQQINDEEGQAISLHQLSMLYEIKKDFETALARSRAAEKIDRKRGDQAGLAADLHQQGLIYTDLTRAAQSQTEAAAHRQAALARFQDSLAISRRIGDEAGAADSLGALGNLLLDAGQMAEAIAAFNEFVETQQRLNNPAKLGIGLEWLGRVHEAQGHYEAALEKYQQALALLQKYGSPREAAVVENDIARVRAKMQGGG